MVETWRSQAVVHERWTLLMANPDRDEAREAEAEAEAQYFAGVRQWNDSGAVP